MKASRGCTVVVPFREEMGKRHLKVTGDLGRVVFMVRLPMALSLSSVAAHPLNRNLTSETQRPSKKAFDIRMSFTILLDETTLQSMASSHDFTNYSG